MSTRASTSVGGKSAPSDPEVISSGKAPWADATGAVPAAIASTATMPNVSSHCEGTTTAREPARMRDASDRDTWPAIRTLGWAAAQRSTAGAISPPPTTTSRRPERGCRARKPSHARIRNEAPFASSSRPT